MSSAMTATSVYTREFGPNSSLCALAGQCACGQIWSCRVFLCAWARVVPRDEVSDGLIEWDPDAADVHACDCIRLDQQPALSPLVDVEGQVLLGSSHTILSSSILWLGI